MHAKLEGRDKSLTRRLNCMVLHANKLLSSVASAPILHDRLFSYILKQIRACGSHNVAALIASASTRRKRQGLRPLIAACHTDFI